MDGVPAWVTRGLAKRYIMQTLKRVQRAEETLNAAVEQVKAVDDGNPVALRRACQQLALARESITDFLYAQYGAEPGDLKAYLGKGKK